jgi:CheY-like chemotaxis protein/MinD-like ATPase involved in chromosome partitioning or flagellar assembly
MSPKILIVDDDLKTLRLVGLMLQRQGYEIVAANNGTQAMGMARNVKPDMVVLDIMMPDVDGYEVTRQLRKDPDTATIPIILFTAKSQVDDKVEGDEAGADGYLTKPVHPAELIAKIKGLLARGRSRQPEQVQRGFVVGVISSKGGMCSSTIALNLALAYHNRTREKVIAAELKPSQGTWSMEMGFGNAENLNNLLRLKPSEITTQKVENELMQTTRGIRLLLASYSPKDSELITASVQLFEIVDKLSQLAQVIFLDIGSHYTPALNNILSICKEVILLTEPQPMTTQRTKALLDYLMEAGFGKSKFLSVVQSNRVPAAIQLTALQTQEILKYPLSLSIPPSAEQAYYAFLKNVPIFEFQSGSLLSRQYEKLADLIQSHTQA